MSRRRDVALWLSKLLALSMLNMSIGFGIVDLGLWWANVALVLFVSASFIVHNTQEMNARQERAANARPREGWLIHADGSKSELRFIETGNPGEFVPVTLDGARVYLRPHESMTLDQIRTDQRILLHYLED